MSPAQTEKIRPSWPWLLRWCLPLLVVPVVMYLQFPGLFDGSGFPSEPDILQLEIGARRWFFDHLKEGVFAPLSPASQLGVPLFGAPTYGLLYPINWLFLLDDWIFAAALATHLNALLFASGWVASFKRLGFSWSACHGVPLLFLVCGPVFSFHAVSTLEMASLSFTGWTVYSGLRFLDFSRRGGTPWGALSAAIFMGIFAGMALLAGDPFMVPLSFLAALGLGLYDETRLQVSRKATKQRVTSDVTGEKGQDELDERPNENLVSIKEWSVGVVVAGVASVFIALPLLLEGAQMFLLSPRALGLSRYEAMAFSTPPSRWLEVISPLFQLQQEGVARQLAGAMNSDWWYPSLSFGFIECAIWLLGTWAIFKNPSKRQKQILGLFVVAILTSAFLTLGSHSALSAWIWENVPPFSKLRFPERMWRYVVFFSLPIWAIGTEVCVEKCRFLVEEERQKQKYEQVRNTLAWSKRRQIFYRLLPAGLVVGATFELLLLAPSPLTMNLAERIHPPPLLQNLIDKSQKGDGIRIGVFNALRPETRFDFRHLRLPMLRTADTLGATALKYAPPEEFAFALAPRFYGLSHVVALQLKAWDENSRNETYGLQNGKPLGESGFSIYETRAGASNRALFLTNIRLGDVVKDVRITASGIPRGEFQDAKTAMKDGIFFVNETFSLDEKGRLVPLSSDVKKRLLLFTQARSECKAPISLTPFFLDDSRTKIDFDVDTPCPGVISIPWRLLPGWQVRVNDKPVGALQINDLTLGVLVNKGHSHLELRYAPRTLWTLWLSLFVLLLGMSSALLHWRREPQCRRRV
ncbi:MAG: YfhO family protein [Deltaproteobacteria bacterium]|nr:YfhO family protein [Deltaproteobacteria bacterium]